MPRNPSKYFQFLSLSEQTILSSETIKQKRKNILRKGMTRKEFLEKTFGEFVSFSDYNDYIDLKNRKVLEVKRRLYQRKWQNENRDKVREYMRQYGLEKYKEVDSSWRISSDLSKDLYESKNKLLKKNKRLDLIIKQKNKLTLTEEVIKMDIDALKQKIELIKTFDNKS